MSKVKINYSIGDIVGVPINGDPNKLARCVIARMDGSGGVFGYFFHPSQDIQAGLVPKEAILVGLFGDLGIAIEKTWPIIGVVDNFNLGDWSIPELIRVDEKDKVAFIVQRDEETLEIIDTKKVSLDNINIEDYHNDGAMGAGFVEQKLAMLID